MERHVATPFRVVLSGGRTVDGKTLPIDYVVAERQAGQLKQFEGEMYATMLACRRKGVEFAHVDDFLAELEDYVVFLDEDGARNGAVGNGEAPDGGQPSPASATTRTSRRETSRQG